MLEVGSALPTFVALNQKGKEISSKDLIGKKLVVFFYPKASTPTCTIEVCNLRDHYAKLKRSGYRLIGISADSVQRQKNFHEKNGLPFDLLADESNEIAEAFGVWKEKKNFGKTYMGIVRTTFVFDERGTLTRVIDKVKSKEASEQILSED